MGTIKEILYYLWQMSPQKIWRALKNTEVCGIENSEYRRLLSFPAKVETEISFFGKKLIIADAPSFLYMHREIFINEIYNFKTKNNIPFIIDGGANIGLSVIYTKNLYPEAKIIAFEPDPNIFRILEKNIRNFNLTDVILFQEGLASKECTRQFIPDKSDGGRFIENENPDAVLLKVVPLAKYISDNVDFLKLDIEGCETEVLTSIEEKLLYIKNIFVEYHSYREKEQTLDEILSILSRNKFRYRIQSVYSNKSPFVNIPTEGLMDMQLNIFAHKAE